MIQLNLNLTGYACMRHGLDKTCSSFHTCASMRGHVHKILKMLGWGGWRGWGGKPEAGYTVQLDCLE